MARVKFQIGDEVAVVDDRGEAWRITQIVDDRFGMWRTAGSAGEVGHWSKTGLVRDSSVSGLRIVPATDEHRRTIRIRNLRTALSGVEWRTEPNETIEAVAAIMGWTNG